MGILGAIFGSGPKPVQTPFSNTSTGSTNSTFTGSTSGTQTPIVPEGYVPAMMGMQPGAGGLNPTQQGSVDWYSRALGSQDPAGLDLSMGYIEDALRNRGAPTLAALAASGNPAYAAPKDVVAAQGSKFMDSYRNPFEDQVVGAALSDLERKYGSTLNASNMQQAAAGAFGGGRHALRDAAVADDYLRTVGATSGGLRAQGFNTAAGLGMMDADRTLNADKFNNEMLDSRQRFDAELGMKYNDQRDSLAKTLADMGVVKLGVGQELADGMFNMGTTGQSQNLDWLRQFAPLFGSQNNTTQTGTESGTQTGSSSGYNTQIQPGSGGLVGSLGPLLSGLGGMGLKF